MTARTDYPFVNPGAERIEQYEAMCDEIDGLRTSSGYLCETIKGLNELVSELTKHADAMHGLIIELDIEIDQTGEAANLARYGSNEKAIKKILAAYSDFIREA